MDRPLKRPARQEGEAPCFGRGYEPEDELTPACYLACLNRALLTEAGCFAFASLGQTTWSSGWDPTLTMDSQAKDALLAKLSTRGLGPSTSRVGVRDSQWKDLKGRLRNGQGNRRNPRWMWYQRSLREGCFLKRTKWLNLNVKRNEKTKHMEPTGFINSLYWFRKFCWSCEWLLK